MTDRLQEIRARLDAATPGPNQLAGRQRECNGVWVHYSLLDHAPGDIAWLLAEVERLQKVEKNREKLGAKLRDYMNSRDCNDDR